MTFLATSLAFKSIKCLQNMQENLLYKCEISRNEENSAKNMVILKKIGQKIFFSVNFYIEKYLFIYLFFYLSQHILNDIQAFMPVYDGYSCSVRPVFKTYYFDHFSGVATFKLCFFTLIGQ